MEGEVRHLEEQLNLPVKSEKSEVARIKDPAFIGFQILPGKVRVSDKARTKFRGKDRELSRRNKLLSMQQIIEGLDQYLRGLDWVLQSKAIEEGIPGTGCMDTESIEIRAAEEKWKKPLESQRIMIRAGFKPQQAHRVWVRMNRWQSVTRTDVRLMMNLREFKREGLIFLSDFVWQTSGQILFSR